jgi:flagellar biosynthesis/type III secretory pathway M-ring protein FliF/YscJ
MLFAGAITSIINIVNKVEPLTSLKRLLLVLVIFYVIGLIARAIIVRTIQKAHKTKDDVEDLGEEQQSEDK